VLKFQPLVFLDLFKNHKLTLNFNIIINQHPRRTIEFTSNGDDGYKETRKPGYQHEAGDRGSKDFQIDQRNRCVFLKGHKVDLTPKEFELVELLLTDVDRIFMTDEIIKHLWPETNQATKSDLYQYMHLLTKVSELKYTNKPLINKEINVLKGYNNG
jgi:DNA-binding response OmpR family regulator